MTNNKVRSKKPVKEKEPQPILVAIVVKDDYTNSTFRFPPTRACERYVERYRGLMGMEIIKTYEKGGQKYESNYN